MTGKLKFGAGLWIFGGASDRFCPQYSEFPSVKEQIKLAGRVEGLDGVEIIFPSQIDFNNAKEIKTMLDAEGIAVTSINPNIWTDKKWRNGAFTSPDVAVRKAATDDTKKAADLAQELGCNHVLLWPGQDGFDYTFQADYSKILDWTVEGLREVAEYAPEVKFAIEYKRKEPRNFIVLSNVGKTMALINEVGHDNVGINVDFGHALMAKENPAEAIVFSARYNRLFNVHVNDSHGDFDDDMMPGSVRIWETMEFLQSLKEVGYDSYINLDCFFYREDAVKAAQVSIQNLKRYEALLEKLDLDALKEAREKMDGASVLEIIHRVLG